MPSPTGSTTEIISFIDSLLKEYGYQGKINRKGSLIVTVPGKDNDNHRFITAHIDTLGAMVRAIKTDVRLKLDLIGCFK